MWETKDSCWRSAAAPWARSGWEEGREESRELCLGPALWALGVPTEIAPRTPALAIRDRISEGPKQADSRCEHACTRLSQSPPATLAPCPSGSITWPAVGTSGAQPATRPTEPPESPARSLVHFSNTWLCCGVLLKAQMKLCYPCDCSKVWLLQTCSSMINTINIPSIYSFCQYPMQKWTLPFSLLHRTSVEDLAAPSPVSPWAWAPRRGGSAAAEVSNPIPRTWNQLWDSPDGRCDNAQQQMMF